MESLRFVTNEVCAFTTIIREGKEIGVMGWRPDIGREPAITFYGNDRGRDLCFTVEELRTILTRFDNDRRLVSGYDARLCHGTPGLSGTSGNA
jgi:hypothetical protein